MKRHLTSLTLAATLAAGFNVSSTAAVSVAQEAQPPLVQIAILLDTSNSMDGLIEQAKGQLWKVVNELISARQNGRQPEVQVGLYEYGKSSLSRESGWIRQVSPLTTDLDEISEELFALKTHGGDEYCGWVIREAVQKLSWSSAPDVYKAIFIAGNEPFTQGPVDHTDSCKAAIAKGIVVNTIHCGDQGTGIATKWQDGALLADGKFMTIDQNRAVVHFEAPQDQEIAQLGVELNQTYLAFGSAGRESLRRQSAQDANAQALAPAGASYSRAVAKASSNYRNANWDLVDAVKDRTFKLAEVKAEELPAEMQRMSPAERKAYIENKAKERTELQARINTLNDQRNKFVAEKLKQTAATNTLDTVMTATIREQAQRKSYRFE
jgi:hypothetical protein